MIKKLTLEISFVHSASAVYDAIGETLFYLAEEGIIDDKFDDGWAWKEEEISDHKLKLAEGRENG